MGEFDIVVGNVPWDRGIDLKFLLQIKQKLLKKNGLMAIITSASYLNGGAHRNKEVREILSNNTNITHLFTYPAGVFFDPVNDKPIKAIGACIILKNGSRQNDEIELCRYFNDIPYYTTTNMSAQGTPLFIGDEGKELWNICGVTNLGVPTIPLIPYTNSDKPKVHFNSKLDLAYLGTSKSLANLTGRSLLTGVQLDLDGSNPWVPTTKKDKVDKKSNSAKRYMLEFNKNEEHLAKNTFFHLSMRVFGLLLSMTNTISHVSDYTIGKLPYDVLQDKYDSKEEYERAYYQKKGFSKKLIEWIKLVGWRYAADEQVIDGKKDGKLISLKHDTTVNKITRSLERVKRTGEIFTPSYYIDDIMNKLEENNAFSTNQTVLEPSCGNGNFLVEVISRKIESGCSTVDTLNAVYGLDIMPDNIEHCKERILDLVGNKDEYRTIINHNIVCADAFAWDYKHWRPRDIQLQINESIIGNLDK